LGIAFLPPDINRSGAGFTVEIREGHEPAIRYALAAVRNVGEAAMDELVAEREGGGPFKDLFDFAARLDNKVMNKRQLESLAAAGAFDELEPNRARAFQAAETLVRFAAEAREHRRSGQANLFGEELAAVSPSALPEAADWPAQERLAKEFEAIGFYLSAHPLDGYQRVLTQMGAVSSSDLLLKVMSGAARVKLGGSIVSKKERTSARGNRFAFVSLTDNGGTYEVVVFSELLASARELLEPNTLVLVTADARLDGDSVRLTAQAIEPLASASGQVAADILIELAPEAASDAAALSGLRDLIAAQGRGKSQIHVVVPVAVGAGPGSQVAEIFVRGGIAINAEVIAAIRDLEAVKEIYER